MRAVLYFTTMRIDRTQFFTAFRRMYHARHGSLSQETVDGLNRLLSFIESDLNWKSVKHISYFIATVLRETSTFQPVKEKRARAGTPLRAVQDKYWHTNYYGRGLIQLTHKRNYEKAGRTLGVDLVSDPDKALEPEIAYEIASRGMREGWFTGKKLSDYINERKTDYFNARRIVNGLDHAEEIARNASAIEATLRSAIGSAAPDASGADEGAGAAVEPPKPAPQDEKAGEAAPDTPALPGQPVVGGRPEDPPKQASTGSLKAKIIAAAGSLPAIWTAVKGFIDGNTFLVALGIICLTLLALSLIFRTVLMDWLRMKLASDPSRYNVR